MSDRRATHRYLALLGLLAGVASFAAAPQASAGGPWQGWGGGGGGASHSGGWGGGAWRAGGWGGWGGWGGGAQHPGGWQHPMNGWQRAGSPFPHAPAGNGFGVRNPYPHVDNFSTSRTVDLPGGRDVTYDRTFTRSGYGDYTYDRSVTGPGGHTRSVDTTQTYNPANGSYMRTTTTTGFNGRTLTATTDFDRTSRGNYTYSYTDVGPNGKDYSRNITETYNPTNHDLTRTGATTLRDGQSANYTTTVNNAGGGIYDYSTNWTGFKGGTGSVTSTYNVH